MRRVLIALTALIAATALPAQTLTEEAPPPDKAEMVKAATAAAEAGGAGPYKALMLSDPRLPTHTLFRPKNMVAAGKLPIIAWGNGACTNMGNRFRYFLTEIASHGYLIVAIGPKGPSTAEWKTVIDPTNTSAVPAAERPVGSYAAQLNDAIDWATAENSRKGSAYFGRLNPAKVAVMGQSCGGLQAISAAADKRVTTAMILNSGSFAEGTRPLAGTGDATKASLRRFHAPVAYISGDESDQAWKNSNADFAAITTVPVFRAWKKGVGHAEHYRAVRGGPFTPVAQAWLDWHLRGNLAASKMFVGANCTLCKDSEWVVQRKGM